MRKYILLCLISLTWGSQFLFNAWALKYFTPESLGVCRAGIGTVVLSLLLPFFKEPKCQTIHPLRYWSLVAIVGLFEASLPFLLIGWGQQYVSSAVASVITSTVALFALVFVMLFVANEKINTSRIIAIFIGFVGVLILFMPSLLQANWGAHFFAQLSILAGAFCFAVSLILIRKLEMVKAPIKMARDILLCSAVQMILLTAVRGKPFYAGVPDWRAWMAIFMLGIFAGGVVYVLYVKLIRLAGASFASMANYLVPVVGVLLGIGFMHDQPGWNVYIALLVLLFAMLLA